MTMRLALFMALPAILIFIIGHTFDIQFFVWASVLMVAGAATIFALDQM